MSEELVQCRLYTIKDVSVMLDVSASTSQRIIRELNELNKKEGYIVVSGKIGKEFFDSKIRK